MAGFFEMNLENLKLLGFNIKDYTVDLILLLVVGLLTNEAIEIFNEPLHNNLPFDLPSGHDIFPLTLAFIKVIVWILAFLYLRWFWQEKVKTYISMKWPGKYSFDINKEKLTDVKFLRAWIFQGNVQPLNGGLLVTNSNSGCLIRPTTRLGVFHVNRIWKNFTANVEIDFPSQNLPINPINANNLGSGQNHFVDSLGIIFRAQSLDDYFMIQIMKGIGCLVFRPHVRVGGNWEVPYYNLDSNSLQFISPPFLLNIVVKNNTVVISSGNSSIRWILPTHVEPNLIQQAKKDDKILGGKAIISEVYFRDRAGMFGFRCFGDELALIRSLDIHWGSCCK